MSANRIFLVCSHCRELESALLLAERADGDAQYIAASTKRADDWYARHQRCGRDVDKFQIAYHRPLNWDVPELASKAASGVRLALATSGATSGATAETNGSGGES